MSEDSSSGLQNTTPRQRLKRWRILLLILGVILTCWLGISYAVTKSLTSRKTRRQPEPIPADVGVALQDVRIQCRDGIELGAWLFEGDADQPCLILLHGNGGSRKTRQTGLEYHARVGRTVLAVTMRVHGDSDGDTNDFGYSQRLDVIAAVEWLQEHYPGRPIIINGRSLGAAAAIFAGQELDHRVAGYVLEQPYKDLVSACWNRVDSHLPPVLDVTAYCGMRLCAPLCLPVPIGEISPRNAVAQIPTDIPLLVIAGRDDRFARLNDVQAVCENCGPNMELVILDDIGHISFEDVIPDQYWPTVEKWLAEVKRREHPVD